MAKGTGIIVSNEPRGRFLEGIISGTPKPGTMLQVKSAVEPVNGRHTWEAFSRSADGDRGLVAILLPDFNQGMLATDAYVSGARGQMYCPLPGEEMNVLKLDIAGTADDLLIGGYLIVDTGTGKFVGTTGTPQAEVFVCLETVTDPTADQLVWAMKT